LASADSVIFAMVYFSFIWLAKRKTSDLETSRAYIGEGIRFYDIRKPAQSWLHFFFKEKVIVTELLDISTGISVP